MTPEYALVLVVSLAAVACSLFALRHSPTETVRRMAQEALERSVSMQTSWEAFRGDVNGVLSAINEERERSEKARARARSAQQRAEQNTRRPQTRDEALVALRERAGII